ncbi:MAG: hypothetical protein IIA45_00960 [Bacteroidetes bacterium]|nr:hypothetical protein [Bacteroidota bacterium]
MKYSSLHLFSVFCLTCISLFLFLNKPAYGERIAAGGWVSLVICSDSFVYATGRFADVTDTNLATNSSLLPIKIPGLSSIIAVACGFAHCMALKADGTVWVWGYNSKGQLGDSSFNNTSVPIQLKSLKDIIKISAGSMHSLALQDDGTVWVWGWDQYGALGQGTNNKHKNYPIKVSGVSNIIDIEGGQRSSLVIKNDGTLWAWGRNSYGQLGVGNNIDQWTPVKITALSNVVEVSSGWNHSMVLLKDKTVWSFGDNWWGQLGIGTNGSTHKNYPVKVDSLSDVRHISVGGDHSLAIKNDSSLWSWGNNWIGNLGDSTNVAKSIPTRVKRNGFVEVEGGRHHTIAIAGSGVTRSGQKVLGFGSNSAGELGDGSKNTRIVPIEMNLNCLVYSGINDPVSNSNHIVNLYPNPVQQYGILNINFNTSESLSDIDFVVSDMLGRIHIRNNDVPEFGPGFKQNLRIPIGNLPPGIYSISIYSENIFRGSSKFIVQ